MVTNDYISCKFFLNFDKGVCIYNSVNDIVDVVTVIAFFWNDI